MKKTIAILVLAAAGITTVNAGLRFGINIGFPIPAPVIVTVAPVAVAPPPVCEPPAIPAPIVETVPVCPTPGFVWVDGNWGWHDNHWVWTRGHWGPPTHWGHGRRLEPGNRGEHHESFRAGYHRDGRR